MNAGMATTSFSRTILRPEEAIRVPRNLRVDEHDRPRASSEDNRWKLGPAFTTGPIAFNDTPPRQDDQPDTNASKQEIPLLSLDETTELFRSKIEDARQDTEHALDGSEEVSEAVKPKLTLDLGHSSIARLPESVVDLIKAEVERLSLSHNQIWHIPLRFSECSHLRYLNIKSNVFREIPRGVYKLPLLEILDIGWNKVRRISKEIRQLTSLRVFSIVHNRVDDLPTELCEMNKLQILKIAKNPLRFKLKKIVEAKEAEVSYSEMTDQERETAVTTEIKRHLRELHQTTTPADPESGGDNSEGPAETLKPARRAPSSRFPVIPSTSEGSVDLTTRSPNQTRPPPIPTRSHFRVASGQNVHLMRRPGLAPLISNGNERNRSNSESVLQASTAARNKRMGMLRKEKSDLDTVEEVNRNSNRMSHYRGLSHGSVLRPRSGVPLSPGGNNSASPGSPRDSRKHRQGFVKRLSSLPEHKKDTDWRSPVIEGAKGILYALYQIHPQISGLIAAIKSKDSKRSSLEFTFYNASTHVDRLNEALDRADAVDIEDEDAVENAEQSVQRDCATCVMAYTHVTAQLQDSVPRMVANTDSRYVRTLMLLLYGSMIEIKNAISSFGIDCEGDPARLSARMSTQTQIHTILEEATTPQQPIRSATPTRDRFLVNSKPGARLRSDTTIHQPILEEHAAQSSKVSQGPQSGPLPTPVHLTGGTLNGNTYNSHNTTSTFVNGNTYNSNVSYTNGNTLTSAASSAMSARSRSNSRNASNYSSLNPSLSSSIASTPRSGETFHLRPLSSFGSRVNPATGLTDAQEESLFEQIFLALTKAYDAALSAVPLAKRQFVRCLEAADESRQPKEVRDLWTILIRRCNQCLDVSEALQIRLVNMRLKDPTVFSNSAGSGRNDPSFWQLCKTFMQSFVELVTDMREAKDLRLLAPEIVVVLRPVQRSSREAGRLIDGSPWRYLTEAGANAAQTHMPYASTHNTYNNGPNGTNGHAYYPSSTQHQFNQSPFPPPVVPVPPLPNSAAGSSASPGSVPLPATPLSAALGPAAQATVPSTPASAYGDQFFAGNVFQRADSLLNMPQAGNMNFLNRR